LRSLYTIYRNISKANPDYGMNAHLWYANNKGMIVQMVAGAATNAVFDGDTQDIRTTMAGITLKALRVMDCVPSFTGEQFNMYREADEISFDEIHQGFPWFNLLVFQDCGYLLGQEFFGIGVEFSHICLRFLINIERYTYAEQYQKRNSGEIG